MTGGVEVTPKDDIAADEEGLASLKKLKKRRAFTLYQAGLKDGDELSYLKDEGIKAVIIGSKKVTFERQEESLSSSALKLLHRDGYDWQQANGWSYWTYEDETIAERLKRMLETEDED